MEQERKPGQQTPLAFRIVVGVLLPVLLILIGLHDVVAGETLFVFSSSEFRHNIARYALVETAARVSGVATIGLGVGMGLRCLPGLLNRTRLATDRLAVPMIIVSITLFFVAHWFLPGYVSLTAN